VARRLISTLLTVLLLACPLLCGADQVGHSVQHGHAVDGPGHDDGPNPCPSTGDDCVCRGAVPSSDGRAAVPHADASTPLVFFAFPLLAVQPLHRLTWQGSPTGLASWGNSLTIRALLQNYRC
jgi:hypothetical protein